MPVQQVFLSYSHRDDEPYGPQNLRWVEQFERALRKSIDGRLGSGRVELWRDLRRLAGNEFFDDQIERQLDRSAIFVTVLSQHYLSSAYCKQELQAFGQRHLERGDLRVDTLSRIVKVYRRAIDRADLRRFVGLPALIPEVDRNPGFELFYKDDSGIDRDVLLDPGKAGLYWQRADDIALAIKRMLDAGPNDAVAAPERTMAAVYLAHTASDMKEVRESLQRELEDRGSRVLPEQELPEDAEGFSNAVKADLQRASLSVHLIGARYGSIPDGTDKSGVELQTELALAQQGTPLRSLLWSPTELAVSSLSDVRQRAFVEELETAAFEPRRAEFVRSSLDQLRALLVDRLRPPSAAPSRVARTSAAEKQIYLVCDPIDRAEAKSLHTALKQLGFDVMLPSLEGTTEELMEENKANLVDRDVMVVLWGQTREAWVRSKLREAQQAPGWGRDRPFLGKFIVIGPPDSPAKVEFDVPQGIVTVRGVATTEQLEALLK